ncbi:MULTISPECIES: hypothetical protein [unclassified Mesorhizobium]|uniref:hypothetical protein n=1 Tax=unclassified Mesorhizobium TaxID=325217 RepID=UPI001127FCC1|nr:MULTISPECIES: hypothetical protein [unclassified Mesorhizobium]TPN02466.1 hypothetical protein FJ966_04105 [Mesorhizobium sp. B2-1-5]TPN14868.1 hypothetical protein FJ973_11980 [Mesorhizobium sp. B2-1-3]
MMVGSVISAEVERTVEETVRDLVRLKRINGGYYVNLPLLYPDGSFVTVRIDQIANGVRVSDAGFAYREVEDLNAAKSFKRTANKVAESTGVTVGDRVLYIEAPIDDIHRAILDVAESSWRVADHICQRIFDEDDEQLANELNERLVRVFGLDKVDEGKTIIGASTNPWEVSAVVAVNGHTAVFQAVSNHANSVYRASTAFHDLAALDKPPRLIAVVRDRGALGSKLGLLSPGRIIEDSQPDELFRKAAA